MASLSAWGAALAAGVFGGAAWVGRGLSPAEARSRGRIEPLRFLARRSLLDRVGSRLPARAVTLPWRRCWRARSPATCPSRRARRSVVPNSMPFLALPFLGAALLALVRGAPPRRPDAGADLVPRVGAFAGAMGGRRVGGARGPEDRGDRRGDPCASSSALSARSRELDRRRGAAREQTPEELRETVRELGRELERQARALSHPCPSSPGPSSGRAARADALALQQEADPAGDPDADRDAGSAREGARGGP